MRKRELMRMNEGDKVTLTLKSDDLDVMCLSIKPGKYDAVLLSRPYVLRASGHEYTNAWVFAKGVKDGEDMSICANSRALRKP